MHNMQNLTVFTMCRKYVNNMLIYTQNMRSMSLIQYAKYINKYVEQYALICKYICIICNKMSPNPTEYLN
jgi:hypothetical protein